MSAGTESLIRAIQTNDPLAFLWVAAHTQGEARP